MPFFPQFSNLFVPPYIPTPPQPELKAYYKLDNDGSGGVSLLDSTDAGKNLVNDYSVTLGTGIINGCAIFDGNQNLFNNDLALGAGDFAISLWVNPTGENYNFPAFVSTREGTDTNPYKYGFGYSLDQGYDGIYWFDDSGGDFAPFRVLNSYVPPNNEWTHIVASRTSGTLTIYYNGGNGVSGSSTNDYSVPITRIGSYQNIGYGQNMTGRIDEIGIWNRGLTASEVSYLYNSGDGRPYPFNFLTLGLLSYWKLDTYDTDEWIDSSGNGNSVIGYNDVLIGTGLISGCAEIRSSYGSYLSTYTTNFDIGTGDISISAWIKPVSYGSGGYTDLAGSVFDFRSSAGTGEWLLIFNDAGKLIVWQNGVAYTSTTTISLNTWTNIIISRKSGTTSFYINGSLNGTFADTENFQSQSFTFGGPVDNPSDPDFLHYNGNIDEVGVWNRALSASEVTLLYNSGTGLTYPFN
jgi:hypothetical protein